MLGERKPARQNKKKSNEPFDKKEKKVDIPKEFIKKIKRLGVREDDAEILFNIYFSKESKLKVHLRIHNNDLEKCQYCPFKYNSQADYQTHLNRHFGIKDFKCDQCGKLYISKLQLNQHYAIHEGIIYYCLLCEGYQVSNKPAMHSHMSRKHHDVVGKFFSWDSVEKYVKTT